MFPLETQRGYSPPPIISNVHLEACFHFLPVPRYSVKVVKAAAQVLNTLWQYRDLRTIYKKVRIHGFSFTPSQILSWNIQGEKPKSKSTHVSVLQTELKK